MWSFSFSWCLGFREGIDRKGLLVDSPTASGMRWAEDLFFAQHFPIMDSWVWEGEEREGASARDVPATYSRSRISMGRVGETSCLI